MKHLVLAFLVAAIPALCADANRIIYSKTFTGSVPPYTQIVIGKDGAGEYREDPKDEDPVKFQLSDAENAQIFSLSDRLSNFARPLESGLKVANMGTKVFRREGPDGAHEVKFNYSEDADAKALSDLFEQIAESQRAYLNLDRVVHYDKLGAQEAVLRVEALHDQKRLVPEAEFLPLLDRIAKNESYLHMARERAATLADAIRKPR